MARVQLGRERGPLRFWRSGALGLVWFSALACASDVVCRQPNSANECVGTGGAGEALGTGAAAGALWVAGGGCSIAGCRPPMVCNARSGLCEHARCGEGFSACPSGTLCDSLTKTCR